MSKAFIIHGAYGNPDENWFPWLKSELENRNYKVITPQLPTPQDQSLENWLKAFESHLSEIDSQTILIGHSIGSIFLLRVLEKLDKPVRAVFLTSGFISDLNNDSFDIINNSFYRDAFKWDKIKKNKITLFHGDSDPYVPLVKARELEREIGSNLVVVKGGGHLNSSAGFDRFDLLLEAINKTTK